MGPRGRLAAALLAAALCAVLCAACAGVARADEAAALRELRALSKRVPHFRVLRLPRRGDVRLSAGQSLTVADLRGVPLDARPPRLGPLTEPYEPSQADGFAEGAAPYVAKGIGPFRFRWFHCELNYGGWHNLQMHDYAATHGFDVIFPYVRKASQRSRMPAGTRWLKWGGFVNWDEWMPKHGIAVGRYDLLVGRDLEGELLQSGLLKDDRPSDWDYLMIDMEHAVLQPEALRSQAWYPKAAPEPERAAFERRYYDGYARTFTAAMAAAKRLGYRNLSVYGWEPFPRTWWGLDRLRFDPATYGPWRLYGRDIYSDPATDILNPSLYVFYWSPQNVASTICNLDLNRALVATEKRRKPIRPYYWTLLHGGDDKYHWWSNQPVPNEDARAWTLFCLMSGVDGFDLWNWSGTGDHHHPRPLRYQENGVWKTADVCVRDAFDCRPEGAAPDAPSTRFARYDFLHMLSADEATGVVRFQKIDRDNWAATYGPESGRPVYAMRQAALTPHVRPESEPVAGVIEGMALAKPFESFLHNGVPQADVSSLDQFLQALPIVRRVKLGHRSLIATYDPGVVHGGAPREIVLRNFAGHAGLTLRVAADDQTRVWAVEEP